MTATKPQECPNCKKLSAKIAKLEECLAASDAELAKAKKHSGNSSKPPSSDITNASPGSKGKKPGGKRGKRKQGGQPGHPRHQRPAFAPDEVDKFWEYFYEECPDCGHSLDLAADASPRVLQQVEIEDMPLRVEEHHALAQWCEKCQRMHYAPFPQELVNAGLVGPRLTALVAYLKGVCHASFTTIRKFFRDVVGFRISRGQLSKLTQKVSASLADPYDELLRLLPAEDVLNVDETGHKDRGNKFWTWCFRAACFTLYRIDPSRGSDVLLEVLGKEFDGILGCDYFSAYRKYMRLNEHVMLQFCLAHLIRDVKFLAEHPDPKNRRYGKRLVEDLRRLFHVIHHRETYKSEDHFHDHLYNACSDLMWNVHQQMSTPECRNIGNRFFKHADSYFRFLTTPGIEPTNNLAEQAIRFVAIHRRMTQGTRGKPGQRWCERIFTVIATCQQQGRSVFQFLFDAVTAHFHGKESPSLAAFDTS